MQNAEMESYRYRMASSLPRCDGNVSDLNQMALKSWMRGRGVSPGQVLILVGILMICDDVNILLLLLGFILAAGITVLPPSPCVTIG